MFGVGISLFPWKPTSFHPFFRKINLPLDIFDFHSGLFFVQKTRELYWLPKYIFFGNYDINSNLPNHRLQILKY